MAEQTHVLFVEDDDVIREATQLALERDGFAVTAMPDGLSGLEAFRADRPDIALLDVMVPGLDGVGGLVEQVLDRGRARGAAHDGSSHQSPRRSRSAARPRCACALTAPRLMPSASATCVSDQSR